MSIRNRVRRVIVWVPGLLLMLVALPGCAQKADHWRHLVVTATAYNSVASQTTGEPTLTAWGDRLKPGMRAIAVSRDLIKLGLVHGTRVKIQGLEGIYIVRDKMNRRWTHRIDIYMGNNVEAARQWGIKHDVRISWLPDVD